MAVEGDAGVYGSRFCLGNCCGAKILVLLGAFLICRHSGCDPECRDLQIPPTELNVLVC